MARRALLIANGSFAHEAIPHLRAPVQDVRKLADLLRREDVGGFVVDLAEDLSSAELRERILRFFNDASPSDQTVIYFSGHGDKSADGQLYFNTADTVPELLEARAVSARYLIERAQKSLSKQTVFLVDCCNSGAFTSSLGVKAGTQTLSKDDFAVEGSRGIAVITASAGLQPAREREFEGGAESLFTRHLIDGIATGQADAEQTGKITLANLFHYVCNQLREEGAKQEPRSFFFGLSGAEPIALNPALGINLVPQELIDKCAHDDWRERKLSVVELAEFASDNPALGKLTCDLMAKLLADPDDRVKRTAQQFSHAMQGDKAEETSAPPPPPPPEEMPERKFGLFADANAFLMAQPDVKAKLEAGNKINAVRAVRAHTQWTLDVAKAWVEPRLAAIETWPAATPPPKKDAWWEIALGLVIWIAGGFAVYSWAASGDSADEAINTGPVVEEIGTSASPAVEATAVATVDATEAATKVVMIPNPPPAVRLNPLQPGKLSNFWLSGDLIGSDNEAAAIRSVYITGAPNRYKIRIANQFNFSCDLDVDTNGDPKALRNCRSPEPDTKTDRDVIFLNCTNTGGERLCQGDYAIVDVFNGEESLSPFGYMKIAKRL